MSMTYYRPKTRASVRLNQQIYRDLSQLTATPLKTVMKYGDAILKESMAKAIKTGLESIHKYAPKATGQLRESFAHQLRANSTYSNNFLQMKMGTYVSYMKYLGRMTPKQLRHPKMIKQKYSVYQRNSKHGKKGQAKRNPGQWRYVYYYGAPRWVKLDDPKAQDNFFQFIIAHIQKRLAKAVKEGIQSRFPAGKRKPWTDRFKVKTPQGNTIKP